MAQAPAPIADAPAQITAPAPIESSVSGGRISLQEPKSQVGQLLDDFAGVISLSGMNAETLIQATITEPAYRPVQMQVASTGMVIPQFPVSVPSGESRVDGSGIADRGSTAIESGPSRTLLDPGYGMRATDGPTGDQVGATPQFPVTPSPPAELSGGYLDNPQSSTVTTRSLMNTPLVSTISALAQLVHLDQSELLQDDTGLVDAIEWLEVLTSWLISPGAVDTLAELVGTVPQGGLPLDVPMSTEFDLGRDDNPDAPLLVSRELQQSGEAIWPPLTLAPRPQPNTSQPAAIGRRDFGTQQPDPPGASSLSSNVPDFGVPPRAIRALSTSETTPVLLELSNVRSGDKPDPRGGDQETTTVPEGRVVPPTIPQGAFGNILQPYAVIAQVHALVNSLRSRLIPGDFTPHPEWDLERVGQVQSGDDGPWPAPTARAFTSETSRLPLASFGTNDVWTDPVNPDAPVGAEHRRPMMVDNPSARASEPVMDQSHLFLARGTTGRLEPVGYGAGTDRNTLGTAQTDGSLQVSDDGYWPEAQGEVGTEGSFDETGSRNLQGNRFPELDSLAPPANPAALSDEALSLILLRLPSSTRQRIIGTGLAPEAQGSLFRSLNPSFNSRMPSEAIGRVTTVRPASSSPPRLVLAPTDGGSLRGSANSQSNSGTSADEAFDRAAETTDGVAPSADYPGHSENTAALASIMETTSVPEAYTSADGDAGDIAAALLDRPQLQRAFGEGEDDATGAVDNQQATNVLADEVYRLLRWRILDDLDRSLL